MESEDCPEEHPIEEYSPETLKKINQLLIEQAERCRPFLSSLFPEGKNSRAHELYSDLDRVRRNIRSMMTIRAPLCSGLGMLLSGMSNFKIWSDEEAIANQVSQEEHGVSSCGYASILTALKALGLENVDLKPEFNKRACDCLYYSLDDDCKISFAQFLLGRSTAGLPCDRTFPSSRESHRRWSSAVEEATDHRVCVKWFPYMDDGMPAFGLSMWRLMNLGCVFTATMNLQCLPNEDNDDEALADAWHGQFVYGIDEAGVHLTNPVSFMPWREFLPCISSDRNIRVRTNEILHHLKDANGDRLEEVGNIFENEFPEDVGKAESLKRDYRELLNEVDKILAGKEKVVPYSLKLPYYGNPGLRVFYLAENTAAEQFILSRSLFMLEIQ